MLCLLLNFGPIAIGVMGLLKMHHWLYYLSIAVGCLSFVVNLVCLILYIRANKKDVREKKDEHDTNETSGKNESHEIQS